MRIARTDRPAAPGRRLLAVILAIGLAVTILATYTLVHEAGHALLGLLFGGSVNSFSISFWDISAYVGLDGDFSTVQSALISVAGIGLPLILCAAFVALVPRRPRPSLELTRAGAVMCVLSTLLAWMIIPLLYLAGRAPGDDSANFLRITGAPPILVAAVALALYLAGWLGFFARAGGPRAAVDGVRRAAPGLIAPGATCGAGPILAAGLAVVSLAIASSLYLQRTNPLVLPSGYAEVARYNLAEAGLDRQAVHRFTLERPAQVSLLVVLQDIQAGPAEIALAGPDGRQTFFSIGASAKIGRARVNPKDLPLGPGEYRVELTFPRQAGGEVVVYLKGPS